MTDIHNLDICRLCLSAEISNLHTYSLLDEPEILQKVLCCLPIIITIEESLPKKICVDCYSIIEIIHKFYQKVTENDQLLKNAIKNKELNNLHLSPPKFNLKVKEENESTNIENCSNSENIKPKIEILCTDDADLSPTQSDCEEEKPVIELAENTEFKENHFNETSIEDTVNKNETNLVLNEKTDSLNENINKFKCLTCFELCDTKNLLLIHYNTIHNPEKGVKDIMYECVTSDGKKVYKCKVCGKIYNNKKNISRHVIVHGEERPFICKICGRTYRSASEIIRHARAHDGTRLHCRICAYSTAYRGALALHERRHDSKLYKYNCEHCGKGFQVKTWFLQHQNIHTGLKPFVCDICGVGFHMDRYLTTHKSSVHPQTSNLKRYVCTHCSLPCDSRNAFNEHLKEHGIKTSFLCDLCGKTLSNAEQLKFHKRMHLGVKPFSCSTCNKAFTKKFNLQLHERTHTGEKSYECDQCGNRYTQPSALRRHSRRNHSDADRHKCSKCSKTFATQNLLTSHHKLCS